MSSNQTKSPNNPNIEIGKYQSFDLTFKKLSFNSESEDNSNFKIDQKSIQPTLTKVDLENTSLNSYKTPKSIYPESIDENSFHVSKINKDEELFYSPNDDQLQTEEFYQSFKSLKDPIDSEIQSDNNIENFQTPENQMLTNDLQKKSNSEQKNIIKNNTDNLSGKKSNENSAQIDKHISRLKCTIEDLNTQIINKKLDKFDQQLNKRFKEETQTINEFNEDSVQFNPENIIKSISNNLSHSNETKFKPSTIKQQKTQREKKLTEFMQNKLKENTSRSYLELHKKRDNNLSNNRNKNNQMNRNININDNKQVGQLSDDFKDEYFSLNSTIDIRECFDNKFKSVATSPIKDNDNRNAGNKNNNFVKRNKENVKKLFSNDNPNRKIKDIKRKNIDMNEKVDVKKSKSEDNRQNNRTEYTTNIPITDNLNKLVIKKIIMKNDKSSEKDHHSQIKVTDKIKMILDKKLKEIQTLKAQESSYSSIINLNEIPEGKKSIGLDNSEELCLKDSSSLETIEMKQDGKKSNEEIITDESNTEKSKLSTLRNINKINSITPSYSNENLFEKLSAKRNSSKKNSNSVNEFNEKLQDLRIMIDEKMNINLNQHHKLKNKCNKIDKFQKFNDKENQNNTLLTQIKNNKSKYLKSKNVSQESSVNNKKTNKSTRNDLNTDNEINKNRFINKRVFSPSLCTKIQEKVINLKQQNSNDIVLNKFQFEHKKSQFVKDNIQNNENQDYDSIESKSITKINNNPQTSLHIEGIKDINQKKNSISSNKLYEKQSNRSLTTRRKSITEVDIVKIPEDNDENNVVSPFHELEYKSLKLDISISDSVKIKESSILTPKDMSSIQYDKFTTLISNKQYETKNNDLTQEMTYDSSKIINNNKENKYKNVNFQDNTKFDEDSSISLNQHKNNQNTSKNSNNTIRLNYSYEYENVNQRENNKKQTPLFREISSHSNSVITDKSKIDSYNTKFDNISTENQKLREEVDQLKKQVDNLQVSQSSKQNYKMDSGLRSAKDISVDISIDDLENDTKVYEDILNKSDRKFSYINKSQMSHKSEHKDDRDKMNDLNSSNNSLQINKQKYNSNNKDKDSESLTKQDSTASTQKQNNTDKLRFNMLQELKQLKDEIRSETVKIKLNCEREVWSTERTVSDGLSAEVESILGKGKLSYEAIKSINYSISDDYVSEQRDNSSIKKLKNILKSHENNRFLHINTNEDMLNEHVSIQKIIHSPKFLHSNDKSSFIKTSKPIDRIVDQDVQKDEDLPYDINNLDYSLKNFQTIDEKYNSNHIDLKSLQKYSSKTFSFNKQVRSDQDSSNTEEGMRNPHVQYNNQEEFDRNYNTHNQTNSQQKPPTIPKTNANPVGKENNPNNSINQNHNHNKINIIDQSKVDNTIHLNISNNKSDKFQSLTQSAAQLSSNSSSGIRNSRTKLVKRNLFSNEIITTTGKKELGIGMTESEEKLRNMGRLRPLSPNEEKRLGSKIQSLKEQMEEKNQEGKGTALDRIKSNLQLNKTNQINTINKSFNQDIVYDN